MAEETTTNVVIESPSSESADSSITFDNISTIPLESNDPPVKVDDTPAESETVQDEQKTDEVEEVEASEVSDNESVTDDATKTDDLEGKPDKVPTFVWKKFRALEKLETGVLTPFRDPNVPIADAFANLQQWMPTRADELAQEAATVSVAAHPNEWLSAILGSETTVESVKAALEGKGATAYSPQQLPNEVESFADTKEAQDLIEYFNTDYPELDWRDPANDSQIADIDLPALRAFRTQVALSEKQNARIKEMQSMIDGMKPEVDSIKEQQQVNFEKSIQADYQSLITTYRSSIEQEAFTAAFKAEKIDISPNDDEITKELKTVIQSQFSPYADGIPSRLDDFISHKFSDKDKLALVIQRVDKYHSQAAKLKAEAKVEKDKSKAAEKQAKANSLLSHADEEKAVLTVLAKQASKEFIQKENAPMKKALEEIQRLRQQLGSNLRTEVVGESSAQGKEEKITWDNLSKVAIR
jgi:hypothetical protein